MTTLKLNCEQRLSLMALIGTEKIPLEDARRYWRLIDAFALTAAEKERMGYQDGPMPRWNPEKQIEDVSYSLEPDAIAIIRAALDRLFAASPVAAHRSWAEPLLAQLDPE